MKSNSNAAQLVVYKPNVEDDGPSNWMIVASGKQPYATGLVKYHSDDPPGILFYDVRMHYRFLNPALFPDGTMRDLIRVQLTKALEFRERGIKAYCLKTAKCSNEFALAELVDQRSKRVIESVYLPQYVVSENWNQP